MVWNIRKTELLKTYFLDALHITLIRSYYKPPKGRRSNSLPRD